MQWDILPALPAIDAGLFSDSCATIKVCDILSFLQDNLVHSADGCLFSFLRVVCPKTIRFDGSGDKPNWKKVSTARAMNGSPSG